MNPSDPLWRELRDSQDQGRKRAGYLARARALRSERPSPPSRLRRWIPLAVASMFAAVLLGAIGWRRTIHADLRFWADDEVGLVGSWVAAPDASALALRFSDGTLFRLSPGSRARVSAIDPNGARIVVERGSANAAVVHRPGSRWLIDVGPFEVVVVGTRFDVSWDPNDEEFRLQLDEGSVLVSGACVRSPTPISQGHVLRVSCGRDREEILETLSEAARGTVAAATEPAAPPAATAEANVLASAAAGGVAQPLNPRRLGLRRSEADGRGPGGGGDLLRSPAWRELIAAGRFREALDLVEKSGFDETCRHASGADLLELGDAARLAGETGRARQAYLAARGKLPNGGRSAYRLGLTAFDQDKDFALAAHWFDVYLAEQPGGDLRREAEGRLMEAWLRAGDRTQARAVAARYLRDYPDGTQSSLARQIATP